jgi:ferric-dicitrate binding protein FerR (iron transport regulator)
MLWWRKKKPQTDAEVLLDALAGVEKREKKKARVRRRKPRTGWKRYADPRILVGLAILLVAILADGVRRENQEFEATIVELAGRVTVAEGEFTATWPAQLQMKLSDGYVVRTGTGATATLSWPDGSLLMLRPDTQLTIKLLEYNRAGAWRGRSFYLKVGQVLAKVAPGFGPRSEMRVYTPVSVAAVRGTVFSMAQDRTGSQTTVACADGKVRAAGLVGEPLDLPGGEHCVIEKGKPPRPPTLYSFDEARAMGFGYGALWTPPPQASRLQLLEYGFTQMLAAPMTILGIGKCGWAFGAIDSARRSAALEALRRLRNHLEGTAEYPPVVDCATLRELGLDPKERDQILTQFNNYALERYYGLDAGRSFVLYARARDKARTLYRVSPQGVERATEEEVRRLL